MCPSSNFRDDSECVTVHKSHFCTSVVVLVFPASDRRCTALHGRVLRQAANVPAQASSTGWHKGPATGRIEVTYIQHPMRRLGSAEPHFARMEKCGAALSSIDISMLPVNDALKMLSLTQVLLTRFGSAATWATFLSPNAVAWIMVPGYLNPPALHAAADSADRSAMPYRWRANIGDVIARSCHQCVGAQLGGVSTIFHFPRNFGPLNATFRPGIHGIPVDASNGGLVKEVVVFYVSYPILTVTDHDFDLAWAVALRLLGQQLKIQDREVLINGLSAPSWTDSTTLSDEVKAHIWPNGGERSTDFEAGQLCAALGVLEEEAQRKHLHRSDQT